MEILICNLSDDEQLIRGAYLVNALKKKYAAKVVMLIFSEQIPLAKALSCHYVAINGKVIDSLIRQFYSLGHPLEIFFDAFRELHRKWDKVINLVNDPLNSYIAAYLNRDNVDGCFFNNLNHLQASNDAYALLKDFTLKSALSPWHIVDMHFLAQQISLADLPENFIQTDAEKFKKEIAEISRDGEYKVVACYLQHFVDIVNLLDKLLDDSNFHPLLLANQQTLDHAQSINRNFDNHLKIVQVEDDQILSFLSSVDFLITDSLTMAAMADLVDLPTIQLIAGSIYLNKASRRPGNLILSNAHYSLESITMSDILYALYSICKIGHQYQLSSDVTIYQVIKRDFILYRYQAGFLDSAGQIKRMMAARYLSKYFNMQVDDQWKEIFRFSINDCSAILKEEEEALQNMHRSLLGVIRYYLTEQKDENYLLSSVNKMISSVAKDSLLSIVTLLFKERLVTLSFAQLDKALYKLKDDLNLLQQSFKELDELLYAINKERIVHRYQDAEI